MANGNGQIFDLRLVLAILLPLVTLAVAWGTLQTRLDHLSATTTKLEHQIKDVSIILMNLRLAQQEDIAFRQQWMARWGQFLNSNENN